jgi:hypothetical protein
MANGLGYERYSGASRLIGLSENTLRRYVSKGFLPHYKISRSVFFDPAELRSWFETHLVQAQKETKSARTKR